MTEKAKIPEFEADLNIIQQQSKNPGKEFPDYKDLQKQFDKGPNLLKSYINKYIVPALNNFLGGSVASVCGKNGDEKGNVDLTAEDVDALSTSGGTLSGTLRMNNNRITGLRNPSSDTDPVTLDYLKKTYHGNAGYHNGVYRGKNLGTPTQAHWDAIASGLFSDLYIGDYFTIDDLIYRIAGFDTFYHTGELTNSQAQTMHHAVLVPDHLPSAEAKMNPSASTVGGYAGSAGRTMLQNSVVPTLAQKFGSHLLTHNVSLTTDVSGGEPARSKWFVSKAELLTERMLYGCHISGTGHPGGVAARSQLPLFTLDASAQVSMGNGARHYCWLQDVAGATDFCVLDYDGLANHHKADFSGAFLRPYFCVGGF